MKNIYIIIFFLTVLIWGFSAYPFDTVMSGDILQYSRWADVLISNNFNVISCQKSIEFMVPAYLYMGFINLVALAKIIAGKFWQQLIIIINIFLGAFLSVILANLVYVFTKNKIAVCSIAGLYILNPEIMVWSRFALSDISYMFINFFLFYSIAKFLLIENKKTMVYGGMIIFMFFLNCVYRPIGILMIPVILFTFYLKMVKKEIRWSVLFILIAAFALFLMLIFSAVIKDVSFWPFEFGKSYLKDYVVGAYREGVVVNQRSYTYHQTPVVLADYISITLDRFVHYFYFSDKLFSFRHKMVNYLIYTPLYMLFILGIIGTFKKESLRVHKFLVAIAIITIIGFSLFHALTCIDFAWRYRLPILPYFLFVAGVGLNFFLKSFEHRRPV